MAIETAAGDTGRDTVQGTEMNKLERNARSYKVTATGHECDGGTTDADLASVAARLYSRAASNSGARKNADTAIQDR
jgi:hypothetical protein